MSPTDNFMSPISAKLNGAKQRHFQKYVDKHMQKKCQGADVQGSWKADAVCVQALFPGRQRIAEPSVVAGAEREEGCAVLRSSNV